MFLRQIIGVSLFLFSTWVFANLPYVPVQFPRDEAAHYDFVPYSYSHLKEWWYFNGKLKTQEGRTFGYDIAFFNTSNKKGNRKSLAKMLHIQVADVDYHQSVGEQSLVPNDEAFVSTSNLLIRWKDKYRLYKKREKGKDVYYLKVKGQEGTTLVDFDLKMEPLTTPFLINRIGLMPMPEETNSYYYTIPRFKTSGTIRLGDNTYQIDADKSESWMDHQWGDFKVENYGWEWFSVRLENGILANLFLNMEATSHKVVGGLANIILPNGDKKFISYRNIKITRKNYWQDPVNGLSYPLTYEVSIPSIDLTFTTQAIFPEQEKHGYWEGLCDVSGKYQGTPITGYSYNELVYLG